MRNDPQAERLGALTESLMGGMGSGGAVFDMSQAQQLASLQQRERQLSAMNGGGGAGQQQLASIHQRLQMAQRQNVPSLGGGTSTLGGLAGGLGGHSGNSSQNALLLQLLQQQQQNQNRGLQNPARGGSGGMGRSGAPLGGVETQHAGLAGRRGSGELGMILNGGGAYGGGDMGAGSFLRLHTAGSDDVKTFDLGGGGSGYPGLGGYSDGSDAGRWGNAAKVGLEPFRQGGNWQEAAVRPGKEGDVKHDDYQNLTLGPLDPGNETTGASSGNGQVRRYYL
jgi:hypothetical protein